MQMFGGDNDEDYSAPEPSTTTKSNGSNSEVSTLVEEQLITLVNKDFVS